MTTTKSPDSYALPSAITPDSFVVTDRGISLGPPPVDLAEAQAEAAHGDRAIDVGIDALTAWLVGLGQPWCENSLDGPLRPPEESHAAAPLAALLALWGMDVQLVGDHAARANVVASRRFSDGPTLMLNDHLDTYPSGPASRWQRCAHPYTAAVHGDDVVARGTSDTRGNLAALLSATRAIVREPPLDGTLQVALTVDEERNGVHGAAHIIDKLGLRPEGVIVVEPTARRHAPEPEIALAVEQTGHALLDIRVTGVSSHIWRPDTGANPASALQRILARLDDPARGGHPVCIVGLDAGEKGMAQFTPLTATARVAVVGIGPEVARGHVRDEILEVARAQLDNTLAAHVDYVPGPTFVPGTVRLADDDAVVIAISQAYHEATGQRVERYCKPAFNDTILFRHAGLSAVTFGPGYDGWPVYDEVISTRTMQLAAGVLENAARRFLANAA